MYAKVELRGAVDVDQQTVKEMCKTVLQMLVL